MVRQQCLRPQVFVLVTLAVTGCRSLDPAQSTFVMSSYAPQAFSTPQTPLTLAQYYSLALERQPRVAAARASLAAAEDGRRALDDLRFPAGLVPEVPLRRKQAALGVTAAAAGVEQAERETLYAVTRTYFTVLYARQQQRVAEGVVERLNTTLKAAREALDAGARDVTAADVERATVYTGLAEAKATEAAQGAKRALAALQEAIGLPDDAPLEVAPGKLPEPNASPKRDDLIRAALARRGELIQATVFAEVACLEIEAQATGHRQQVHTFAAGSDVHAVAVPAAAHNNDYRPGAVGPEMPSMLAGPRPDRIQHARSLAGRADAVVATTRNLITLEVTDAFLRWEQASRQAQQARKAAGAGEKLADSLSKDLAAGLKVKVDEVVGARVLAAEARSRYNEYLYQEIIALADLERATAGGFPAGLVPSSDGTSQVPAGVTSSSGTSH
jgi:outer membrane protein TolC